jgi:hypothetical protein
MENENKKINTATRNYDEEAFKTSHTKAYENDESKDDARHEFY